MSDKRFVWNTPGPFPYAHYKWLKETSNAVEAFQTFKEILDDQKTFQRGLPHIYFKLGRPFVKRPVSTFPQNPQRPIIKT